MTSVPIFWFSSRLESYGNILLHTRITLPIIRLFLNTVKERKGYSDIMLVSSQVKVAQVVGIEKKTRNLKDE